MTTSILWYKLYYFLYFFFIYAFIGWCLEVSYAFYKSRKFINRGFLFGPYCPMYGIGSIMLAYSLQQIVQNTLLLFVLCVIICSLIEYATGFVLEFIFGDSWWDYSEDAFNLKGRICLKFSLLWGALSVIFLKVIHPFVKNSEIILNNGYVTLLLNLLLLLFSFDFLLTLFCLIYGKFKFEGLHSKFQSIKNKLSSAFKL